MISVGLETAPILYPDAEPWGSLQAAEPPDVVGGQRAGILIVGRIHADKIDIDLLTRLLRAFPTVPVRVFGALDDAQVADALGRLRSVTLRTDVSDQEIVRAFREAKVFLHLKVHEHFGIAPVEAIRAGCVPVVHDSGGTIEVVPDSKLRYRDAACAIEAVRRVLSFSEVEYLRVASELRGNTEHRRRMDGLTDYRQLASAIEERLAE